jgi:hypothetical protein
MDDTTDLDRPPHPLDYVTEDQIQDLWGIGFTIVKRVRHPDPFHVPAEMVPQSRAYQWWHLVQDKVNFEHGWAPVPASRHDGYFMPFGHKGAIEIGGLGLFEKSKMEVQQELDANKAAAHKQLENWIGKTGAIGISGSVKVGGVDFGVGDETVAQAVTFNPDTKTIDTVVKVPKDMIEHMPAIFEERDRLSAEIVLPDRTLKKGDIADRFYEAIESDKGAPWWPTLYAILLPIAIENVRKRLTEEKNDE